MLQVLCTMQPEAPPARRFSVRNGQSLEAPGALEYVYGGYSTNYEPIRTFSLAGTEIR